MKERLWELIEKEGINQVEFADRIGAQRSNVSHILTGRNHPSFSFIQKVLESFPRVDPGWFINGEGSMYKEGVAETKVVERNLFSKPQEAEQPVLTIETEMPKITEKQANNTFKQLEKKASTSVPQSRKIVKVLFFYDDNTFDDFSPTDKL